MGYTTYFNGSLQFDKPVEEWLVDYISKFSKTRRMKRSPELIKEAFPNWKELCFKGELGKEGEYFVGGLGDWGQGRDISVLDHNTPARTQPSLWCNWEITETELMWNEAEKFYDYEEWLDYLIDNFFAPCGYVLNGDISWEGEESDDFGIIHVEDNVVTMQYGIHVASMEQLATSDMIEELMRRGYAVSKAV
jgi:hypothetical protein